MKLLQRCFCIGFKIPNGVIEIEKKMLVFNFGLQIADFRFVRDWSYF